MATPEMCKYCFDALIHKLYIPNQSFDIEPNFVNEKYPLFVTWYIRSKKYGDFRLRGCIGTFSPQFIHKGLREYSLISALKDRRFNPMKRHEIPHLKCCISLLVNFEEAKHVLDWEIGVHGIRIEFLHPQERVLMDATYLPNVCKEQGWTKMECLTSLYQKAGYYGRITESLMRATKLVRYQSSVQELTFEEYAKLCKKDKNNLLRVISL